MRNMYEYLMVLLESRASRMTPDQAILSLHADYIGGDNANFCKWYFAAQFDAIDATSPCSEETMDSPILTDGQDDSLEAVELAWKKRMSRQSQQDRIIPIALYLLCWGEANQVHFMP